jgi:small ligand-binding sensory domain FIST
VLWKSSTSPAIRFVVALSVPPRISVPPVMARPSFVLVGEPFTGDSEALIEALANAYPGCVQVGGLASGAQQAGDHRLFLGARAYGEGFVGVALTGNIEVDTVVAQGCRPVGEPMFVTRCSGNLMNEIDGRSPADVLSELFDAAGERERELFRTSLFIGLQMDAGKEELGRGDFLVRNILAADPESGSFAVGAILEESQVVQFQLRDGVTAAEDLDGRLDAYTGASAGGSSTPQDVSGALLFSCLGRGQTLYGQPNHDSDTLRRHLGEVSLAGFFGNGEIGPVEGRTFLHGYTSAFGIFRPRE